MRLVVAVVLLLWLPSTSPSGVAGQLIAAGVGQAPPPPPLRVEELRGPPATLAAPGVQEIRLRWRASPAAPAPGQPGTIVHEFALEERRSTSGDLQMERAPELSETQILVVAFDRDERQVHWRLIPDPRTIRGEFPDATGRLSGVVLQRADSELFIALPDSPVIATLGIYKPRWTGSEFLLDPLGSVALN